MLSWWREVLQGMIPEFEILLHLVSPGKAFLIYLFLGSGPLFSFFFHREVEVLFQRALFL